MSPGSLLRNARPIGDVVEIRPFVGVGVFGHHELKHQLLAVALDDVQRRAEAGAILRECDRR